MGNKYVIEYDEELISIIDKKLGRLGLGFEEFIKEVIDNNEFFKESYERLKKENEMYKKKEMDAFAIADAIADGVYVTDKDGIVLAINKGYTNLTGIREEEIIGKNIETIIEEDGFNADSDPVFVLVEPQNNASTLDIIDPKNNKVLKVREPRAISLLVLEEKKEISVITSSRRTKKKVIITGTPFFDNEGNIVQVLTVMRDLTEFISLKEKLDETEKEKRRYLNELKDLKKNQLQGDIVSQSTPMEKIKKLIENVAKTDATILVVGETGVGKEVVAKEIYKNSKRVNGPYIKINCAAIPETLLESELFGYEKGAFTGASQKEKLGLFELANRGTILLDEIGEMPMKLQSKLLRVLQEREIKRIGGINPIKIDVRVIASTNVNLQEQVKKGTFREDLYYRLNVIPITIPPLRERKDDITILAYSFLDKFNRLYDKNKDLDKSAIEALDGYDWPGNVRELENSIERLVIIGDEDIITGYGIVELFGKDKFAYEYAHNSNLTLREAVDNLERNIIEKTLKKYGSTYKAAEILGITQPTVVRKAKALGIREW